MGTPVDRDAPTGVVAGEPSDSELRELVRRYHVTWESRPAYGPGEGSSLAPTGFVIELAAVAEGAAHLVNPDPRPARAVECALERIARAVASSHGAPERFAIHVAQGSVQIGTAHGHDPETTATIELLNREELSRPGSEEQQKQAEERARQVVQKLRDLGAMEGRWPEAS